MRRKVIDIEEKWITITSYVAPWTDDFYGEGYQPIVYYKMPYVSEEECNKLLKQSEEEYNNVKLDAWKPPELDVYWKVVSREITEC